MVWWCIHRQIKRLCYTDIRVKQRRKEIATRLQVIYNKQKHEIKKKKLKQSHLRNSSKVDAFARGGGSGR